MTKTEMKTKRLKWIAALESGKYKQANGQLRDNWSGDAYCCLGVLCKISPEFGKFDHEAFMVKKKLGGGLESFSPPSLVNKSVGLSKSTINTVIRMNDEDGKNFEDIAKHLRKVWKLPAKKVK
jgi:hypothetical protein